MTKNRVGIHHEQNLDTRHDTYQEACVTYDSNFWCEETLTCGTYWLSDNDEVLTKYLVFHSYNAIIGVSVWHFNTSHKRGEWSCDFLIVNDKYIQNRSRTTAKHITCMRRICDNGSWYGYCQNDSMTEENLNKWLGDKIIKYSDGEVIYGRDAGETA